MADREIFGHIDCPCCKRKSTVRITKDKNGAPFGFCENCEIQIRIGGKQYRINEFKAAHQSIAAAMDGNPVANTEQAAPIQHEKPKTSGFDLGL